MSPRLWGTFFALELTGAVGMVVILSTALFCRGIKRSLTWYSFCASWTLSCFSYCLLFFASPEVVSIEGSKLCVVQASLIYSCPALTACTTAALLIHGWFNIHFGLSKPPLESHRSVMLMLLAFPFIAWFMMFLVFLLTGLSRPASAIRTDFHCAFAYPLPGKLSSLLVVIITSFMIPIQISLAFSLRQNLRNDIQTAKMVIRVMLFSFLTLVAFAEGVIYLLSPKASPVVTIILACLPVCGILIFGIQRDMCRAWLFWKKEQRSSIRGTKGGEVGSPGPPVINGV